MDKPKTSVWLISSNTSLQFHKELLYRGGVSISLPLKKPQQNSYKTIENTENI